MSKGPNGTRLIAQGDFHGDRREPAAARHRLCGSVSDSSLGLPRTDRGDTRSPARRREGRQGPVSRRLLHVRLAVQQGPAPRPASRLDTLRQHAELTTICCIAKKSAKCCRSATMQGIGVMPWSPARPRAPDAPLAERKRRERAPTPTATNCIASTEEADRKVVEQVAGDCRSARRAAGASSARLAHAEAHGHLAHRRRHQASASRRCASPHCHRS